MIKEGNMRIISSQKTMIVLLIILLALVMLVATVSAAETMTAAEAFGLDSAVASVDLQGAEGVNGPLSGVDHRLISPWVIDPGECVIF